MHDVGVAKMEFVLIPEMPMSGDLASSALKKLVGAQCFEPVKVRMPSIMSFFEKAKISMKPKNKLMLGTRGH